MSTDISIPAAYDGLKITILGLGTFGGGVAAARFLAERGAIVTITDLRKEEDLEESLRQLNDVSLAAIHLGQNPQEAFTDASFVVVNPAVKPDAPILEHCRNRGVAFSSEIELFLRHNPASVVAVTGSNGKSTTAALTQCLLRPYVESRGNRVWLGGNIGTSLLSIVDEIRSDDIAVLELSSFQLHYLSSLRFAPRVAVVTNFSPNHLDWHPSLNHYRTAKQVLLKNQQRTDFAILPSSLEDESNSRTTPPAPWRVRSHALRVGLIDTGEDGCYFENGSLVLRRGHSEDAVRIDPPASLPGQHNRENIAAAACAAWCLGADPNEFGKSLKQYNALPHRLQLVAHGRGLRFYDDSVATTSESAIAGLRAFSQPCVIIAGGADKGVDLSQLAKVIHQRAASAVLIGTTAHALSELLSAFATREAGPSVRVAVDFEDAFSLAVEVAPPGSIVLLSPGCASFDWFRDFRDRGDQFTHLALQWLKQ